MTTYFKFFLELVVILDSLRLGRGVEQLFVQHSQSLSVDLCRGDTEGHKTRLAPALRAMNVINGKLHGWDAISF